MSIQKSGLLAEVKMPIRQLLFSFSGRIPRSTWWAVSLINLIIFGLVFFMLGNAAEASRSSFVGVLVILYFGWVIWSSLALGAKRWHDMDRPAWLAILPAIPLIGWLAIIFYGFVRGTVGPNRYGDDPLLSAGENLKAGELAKAAVAAQQQAQADRPRGAWPSS